MIDNKVEEYDEDTTRVGPFKVRTTQAPTVDDWKLLELCFGKVEDTMIVVGVEDNEAFHVNKDKFCKGLTPEGWISTGFINCVEDMLCVRECNFLVILMKYVSLCNFLVIFMEVGKEMRILVIGFLLKTHTI